MPLVEIYHKDGFGRRLRVITPAEAASLEHLYDGLYNSIGFTPAPTNTVAPVISGGATTVGTVLSVTDDGTWTGSPTYTYQWYVDDVAAGGETSASFDTTGLSIGNVVKCVVTGTNAGGTAEADSNEITLT